MSNIGKGFAASFTWLHDHIGWITLLTLTLDVVVLFSLANWLSRPSLIVAAHRGSSAGYFWAYVLATWNAIVCVTFAVREWNAVTNRYSRPPG